MPGVQPSTFLELRHASTDHAIFVVVPERRFLAVDGVGLPTAADHRLATETLREIAEHLQRRLREQGTSGSRIGVIECAWSPPTELAPADVPTAFADRTHWQWEQLIELPARITDADVAAAIEHVARVHGGHLVPVRGVTFTEGHAAQVLHVGDRAGEPLTVGKLYGAVADAGYRPNGRLHELLLVDPDQVPAGRGRAILRLPVAIA
jgi:hypothetical protein